MGLLSQRQVDTLRDDTAARLKRLGKYRILRELGRGAMGVVYEAVDSDLGRTVALKLLLRSPQANPKEAAIEEERFLREARLSASLPKHPHIVGVHEAGVLEGHHYIAMEFIEGTLFSNWRRKNTSGLRGQVTVLRDTALAVDHAHQHGIIHRDLKPANVLVDAKGHPHVTDFGLAKQSGQDASLTLTGAGRVAGTPIYMSPEQAEGRRDVDRRTDLWALGVMLFEVLTGRPPFRGETPVDVMMKIVKDPVPAPSTVIREGTNMAFDRVLENICLKALVKDPKHRYSSGRAFAEDLTRWLKGQTVIIAPQPRPRQGAPLGLWVGLGLAVVAIVVAGLFLSSSTPSPDDAGAERSARAERLVGQGQNLLSQGKYADALVAFAEALKLDPTNRAAARGRQEAERKMSGHATAPPLGGSDRGGSPPPAPNPPPDSPALVAVQKARDFARSSPKEVEGQIRLWEAAKIAALGTPYSDEAIRECELARDRHRQAIRAELEELDHAVHALCEVESFGPARDLLLSAKKRHDSSDWDGAIRSRQDDLLKSLSSLFEQVKTQATQAKSRNDTSALAACRNRLAKWKWAEWETQLEETLARIAPPAPPPAPPAPPPGSHPESPASGIAELPVMRGFGNGVCGVAFSPDEKLLATCTFKEVQVWNMNGRVERLNVPGFATSVAFSPDGHWIIAGLGDGTVKIWDTDKLEARALTGHSLQAMSVSFSPDSKSFVSASTDCTVRVWDPGTGNLRLRMEDFPKGAMSVSFSSDGKFIAVGCAESVVRICDPVSNRERRRFTEGLQGAVLATSFSPDGKLVATGDHAGNVFLWEIESGRQRALSGHTKEIRGVAISPDGKWLASASLDGTLRIWEVSSGELRATFQEGAGFYCVAFSPRGNLLAAGCGSWSLRFWQVGGLRSATPKPR
jgi:hypothetical protein